jgi:hypothetical protein
MRTRHLTISFLGFALLAVAFFAWRARAVAAPRAEDPRSADVADLRAQLAELQARVASTESPRAAMAAREDDEPPAATASAPPASPPKETPPPRLTREQATTRFEAYFAGLDDLRGRGEDRALTSAFAGALAEPSPTFRALERGKVDLVTCGNGLCRVELTFPDAAEIGLARTELLMKIGPLSGGASMFVDADRPHVTAYFAQRGSSLPPFPTAAD